MPPLKNVSPLYVLALLRTSVPPPDLIRDAGVTLSAMELATAKVA